MAPVSHWLGVPVQMHTTPHSSRTQLQPGKPGSAARTLWFMLLLCGAVTAAAQDAVHVSPAPAEEQEAAPTLAPAASVPAGSPLAPARAAVPELQSVSALQISLPAGVCPVISGYLLQQCQQNPADPMCSFVPGA